MKNSALLELVNSFSKKELKEFSDYIRSPFFNKNENVVSLYDEICKAGNDARKLQKKELFKKIYGRKTFSDATVRTLMFNLYGLAEDYLAYKQHRSERSGLDLLKQLNLRNLTKSFTKNYKATAAKLVKEEVKDVDHFHDKYMLSLQKELYNIKSVRNLNSRDLREGDIKEQSESLIVFFLLNMVRHYRFMLTRRTTVNIDIDLKFLQEVMDHLDSVPYEHIPSLHSGYKTLKLLIEGREEDFAAVKEYLFKNKDRISRQELYNNLIVLQNFCVQMHNKGKESFARETFDLYCFTLDNGLYSYMEDDLMTVNHYRNITTVALKLKEYDWAEKFINDYKRKLPSDKKENAYNICCSKVAFERNRFEEALEKLSYVKNEDVYYKMEIKQMLLKIYYEMGMYDEALDVCDTFRHFFDNNKIVSDLHARGATNFIKLFSRLVRAKKSGTDKRNNKLKEDISRFNYLIGRDWLHQKAGELKVNK